MMMVFLNDTFLPCAQRDGAVQTVLPKAQQKPGGDPAMEEESTASRCFATWREVHGSETNERRKVKSVKLKT